MSKIVDKNKYHNVHALIPKEIYAAAKEVAKKAGHTATQMITKALGLYTIEEKTREEK